MPVPLIAPAYVLPPPAVSVKIALAPKFTVPPGPDRLAMLAVLTPLKLSVEPVARTKGELLGNEVEVPAMRAPPLIVVAP